MIFPLMSHVSYPKHPASAAQLPSISQHEVLYLGTVELLICGSCAVTAAAMYQRNSYQMLGADCWNQVESIRLVQLEKTI